MITLEPDFERETEEKYWILLTEIQRDERIVKEYERIELIRLKNFIEDQMNSRRFQVLLYLIQIQKREVYHPFEKEIKLRLGDIKIHENYLEYFAYLKPEEVKIVDQEIEYLLENSHQYFCSYKNLKEYKSLINEILNPNSTKESHENEDEDESEQKILTQAQIAFLFVFQGKKFNDPRQDQYNKLTKEVIKFGFTNKTSPEQIYHNFYIKIKKEFDVNSSIRRRIQSINLKIGRTTNKQTKKDLEIILQNQGDIYILSKDQETIIREYIDIVDSDIDERVNSE